MNENIFPQYIVRQQKIRPILEYLLGWTHGRYDRNAIDEAEKLIKALVKKRKP